MAVLRRGLDTVGFVRADQVDAAPLEPLAQQVAVGGFVVDQTLGVFVWPAPPRALQGHMRQRGFDQRRFVRGRRGELNSQRNTYAACHRHPLCTLAAFGLADAQAPFFVGAKLPTANVSSQSSRPCSSDSPRNARQIESQTSASSQSRNRCQHMLGEEYRSGKSFQCAPLRSIHKMPLMHRRALMRLRPPMADGLGSGSSGSILRHCSSVSSKSCRAVKWAPSHGRLGHKYARGASLDVMRFGSRSYLF